MRNGNIERWPLREGLNVPSSNSVNRAASLKKDSVPAHISLM